MPKKSKMDRVSEYFAELDRDQGPDPRDQKTHHGWRCTECGDAVGDFDD